MSFLQKLTITLRSSEIGCTQYPNSLILYLMKDYLPTWAWLSLGTIITLTAILAAFGGLFILRNNDSTTPDIDLIPTDDLAQHPVNIEIAQRPTHTLAPTTTPFPTQTPTPSLIPSIQPTTTTTLPTTTIAPTSTTAVEDSACTPPADWVTYTVQEGDTLFAFQLGANRAGNPASVDEIITANCLGSTFLTINQVLWLPSGAAENAPSSDPISPDLPPGIPRDADCPCTITVRVGWRIEQIADAINRTSVAFSGADFMAVAGPGAPLPSRSFLASVPAGAGLEGFMIPGTYILQNTTTAAQFRDMMLDAFAANAAGIINAATAQGVTPYQAVIMASIIQKESGDANEQRLVASVFYNRIRDGRAFGATVTLMYALGYPGNWWPRLQPGQTDTDSPYNTFIYGGFTPTPISNPSVSALQAAASPAQTNYFYFTGNCNGPGNLYAETYEQHLANVRACG